jgi:hypothetical protein
MDPLSTSNPPGDAESPFTPKFTVALRGGVCLLAASLIWNLLLQREGPKDPFLVICFHWLPSACLVFSLGAALGWFLRYRVSGRNMVFALMTGVLAGLITSVLLASALWIWMNHHDLLGLVINRHSGGFASYSLSVKTQLSKQAWWLLTHVVPVTAGWVCLWALWVNRSAVYRRPQSARESLSSKVALRLNRHLARFVALIACGLGAFATIGLLALCLAGRGSQTPLIGFALVGPITAGLVFLGPWLGPLLHPGGSPNTAMQWTAVALPILLAGLAPFGIMHRPVNSGGGAVAWCGLVTALLFWAATGAFSLGWSLG